MQNMTTCYHPEMIMVHVCETLLCMCVWHTELSEERQLLELLSTRSITVSALKAFQVLTLNSRQSCKSICNLATVSWMLEALLADNGTAAKYQISL